MLLSTCNWWIDRQRFPKIKKILCQEVLVFPGIAKLCNQFIHKLLSQKLLLPFWRILLCSGGEFITSQVKYLVAIFRESSAMIEAH